MAKKDETTIVILRNLGILTVLFVGTLYTLSAALCAATQQDFDPTIPFEWAAFDPSQEGLPMVSWLTVVLSYFLLAFYIFRVVRCTPMCFDYSLSMTFLHMLMTMLVSVSFPTNWMWWVTVILCGLLVSAASEMMTYRLFDLKEIKLDH